MLYSLYAYYMWQQVADICFSGGSFGYVGVVVSTLTSAISVLFGLLMLSYKGQLKSAQERETRAEERVTTMTTDRQQAIDQRNELALRLNITRDEYRDFATTQTVRRPRKSIEEPKGS